MGRDAKELERVREDNGATSQSLNLVLSLRRKKLSPNVAQE